MKEFMVGDKVTCLAYGKGVVHASEGKVYPVYVNFENNVGISYTRDGRLSQHSETQTLYHGHGTFNIEFVEEPEYEYQWLVQFEGNTPVVTYRYFKNAGECQDHFRGYVVIKPIEETKREIK